MSTSKRATWFPHQRPRRGSCRCGEHLGRVRALRVERIGHGTRAEEDPALLDYLAENAIPLEMCPLSNVRTGVVESIEKHPVRRYFERGLL